VAVGRGSTVGPVPRVLLTFDNLGEASELERGTWPQGEPVGRHPSVTEVLPPLLSELARRELTATFFVEAINCEMYPDALHEIAARGHELGVHGWRHEPWGELSAERERELLTRATEAFATLGLPARGFRPPGGAATGATADLLVELGYTWWSPERAVAGHPELVRRAFDWDLVDAYHLMALFADLRRERGDPAQPLAPAQAAERFARRLARRRSGDERDVVVLHPFLMLDPAWFAQVRELLATIGGSQRHAPP